MLIRLSTHVWVKVEFGLTPSFHFVLLYNHVSMCILGCKKYVGLRSNCNSNGTRYRNWVITCIWNFDVASRFLLYMRMEHYKPIQRPR
ncbi:hypothetical protein EUGRSUZ_B00475 [Eucalyptus grandis]|uniref:Uncharacterized protein n=2 Tax=Eucalyptus grandis TaxID=71139 RepID=A0A059CZE2_EUCGR|nr:hypothetical protein EUGRSUZ_B00475 [Eucalyptus grandis]